MSLHEKSVIITGGAGGIGRAASCQLSKAGVTKLAVIDIRDEENARKRLEKEMDLNKIEFIYEKLSVHKQKDFESAFNRIVKKFQTIDIFINAAGIVDENRMEETLAVNLNGTVIGTFLAFEHMRKDKLGKGGAILNVSSVFGLDPFPFTPIYSATKFGVTGLTRSLADDRVNRLTGVNMLMVCPGFTITPLIQLQTLGKIYFPHLIPFKTDLLSSFPPQSAEVVGECVRRAIEDGQNDSVWHVEDSKYQKIKMYTYIEREGQGQ